MKKRRIIGEEVTNLNNLNLISKIHRFVVLTSSSLMKKSFLNETTRYQFFFINLNIK